MNPRHQLGRLDPKVDVFLDQVVRVRIPHFDSQADAGAGLQMAALEVLDQATVLFLHTLLDTVAAVVRGIGKVRVRAAHGSHDPAVDVGARFEDRMIETHVLRLDVVHPAIQFDVAVESREHVAFPGAYKVEPRRFPVKPRVDYDFVTIAPGGLCVDFGSPVGIGE